MEKRPPSLLRVQKYRNLLSHQNKSKRKKKKFMEKAFNYLLSDSYMYAPLISSRPSDCLTSKAIKSSPPSDKSKGVINAVLSHGETINNIAEETSCKPAPSLGQMIKEKENGFNSEIYVVNQTHSQTQNQKQNQSQAQHVMAKKMVHYNANGRCTSPGTRLGHGNKRYNDTAHPIVPSKRATLVTPAK